MSKKWPARDCAFYPDKKKRSRRCGKRPEIVPDDWNSRTLVRSSVGFSEKYAGVRAVPAGHFFLP
ncbi:hypothetical protein [Eubacterium callanderi]|uniref:hypothetical protein n=1 Tax=Eubacterium callanderi TaxID=53442 RepID=UPI0029FF4002|nr:hypothetical protein [Eubacterium callanderi]